MLKKKHRLNLSIPQNLTILEKGNSKFTASNLFLSYQRDNEEHFRAMIIVPKKVEPIAVKRHFYRRRLYLMLEEILQEKNPNFLKLKKDFVLIVKKSSKISQDKQKNLANFAKDLQFLLNKTF